MAVSVHPHMQKKTVWYKNIFFLEYYNKSLSSNKVKLLFQLVSSTRWQLFLLLNLLLVKKKKAG